MLVTVPGQTVNVPDQPVFVFRDDDACVIHGALDPDDGGKICGRCLHNGQLVFGAEQYIRVSSFLTLRAVTRALMRTAADPSTAIVAHARILAAANRAELPS